MFCVSRSLRAAAEMASSCFFKLGEQGGALLLLLTYRTLFGGDIGLNGFKLIAVIRMGGCGAQQYASAECAGAKQRSD